jgi:hypothetical protein
MTVEVRCCCEPAKLLGWVQLEPDLVVEGRRVVFAWAEIDPRDVHVDRPFLLTTDLRMFTANVRRFEAKATSAPQPPGVEARWVSWIALDSGDQPLEVWRKVRAFTEKRV